MRISDWSSDVCSSDLHVIDDRRLRGCDDFASEQRLFAGRHLHFAVIAEALAELAGLGIDGDQAVVERAEEDARLADRAIGGGGVNPVRDAATLLVALDLRLRIVGRSEEHTSELQSLMRISYAVFCLKKKKTQQK